MKVKRELISGRVGGVGVGAGGGGRENAKKMDHLSIIRREVKETEEARSRGDLTGDDDDMEYSRGKNGGTQGLFRPQKTAIAYDSELDGESDDSYGM
jgi:hypothetical protein